MRITYLIGNGFDVNLGLKTRYNDFLTQYKNAQDSDSETIKQLKNNIQQYYDKKPNAMNWSDLEIALGKYTQFLEREALDNPDLCMKECLEDIRLKLSIYLSEQEQILGTDISKQINNIQDLWNDIRDISSGLRPSDKKAIERIKQNDSYATIYDFLSFNYTDVFDRMIEWIKTHNAWGNNPIGTIIHIHGTTKHGMALGVNDESQIVGNIYSDEEPERKNALIKPMFNEYMGEEIDTLGKEKINGSSIIVIYGMSIGQTDKRWWKRIVEWLSTSEHHILIVHKHDTPTIGISAEDYERFTRLFKDDFVQYGNNIKEDIMESMKKRIFLPYRNQFEDFENSLR